MEVEVGELITELLNCFSAALPSVCGPSRCVGAGVSAVVVGGGVSAVNKSESGIMRLWRLAVPSHKALAAA